MIFEGNTFVTLRASQKSQHSLSSSMPSELFNLCLAGPLLLGLSLGLQSIVALVAILGPLRGWPERDDLSYMGITLVHPEYDLHAYLAGCVATMVFVCAAVWLWAMYMRRFSLKETGDGLSREAVASCAFQICAALVGIFAFIIATEAVRRMAYSRWRLNVAESAILLLPMAATWAATICYYWRRDLLDRLAGVLVSGRKPLRFLWDIGFVAFIFLVIYIPSIKQFAGQLLMREGFFHWDHFVMAPAAAFSSGKALGTDTYSMYGIGWPMLFGLFPEAFPLSYVSMLRTFVLYGCLYFIGLYLLLRVATKNVLFATIGTVLAMFLTQFAPIWTRINLTTLWQWASTSIMRSPMDVWFFLFLACHLFARRFLWLFIAGCSVGVAVLLETDTGVPLGIVLILYCAALIFARRKNAGEDIPTISIFHAVVTIFSSVLVCLAGLLVASRGTVITKPSEFFPGWLEGILENAGMGANSLVLLSRVDVFDITFFIFATGTFLYVFLRVLVKLAFSQVNPTDLLMGCVGLFGLSRLLVFVQRSLPNNLYHAGIALSIVLVLLAHSIHERLGSRVGESGGFSAAWQALGYVRSSAPVVLLLVVLLMLWFSPSFHEYPGMLRSMAKGFPEEGLRLTESENSICGLPQSESEFVENFRASVKKMREVGAAGHDAAILDDRSTIYYIESGIRPWGRDSTIFYNTLTKVQQQELIEELLVTKPSYAFIRIDEPDSYFGDTWGLLKKTLEQNYSREGNAGFFEVWHLAD